MVCHGPLDGTHLHQVCGTGTGRGRLRKNYNNDRVCIFACTWRVIIEPSNLLKASKLKKHNGDSGCVWEEFKSSTYLRIKENCSQLLKVVFLGRICTLLSVLHNVMIFNHLGAGRMLGNREETRSSPLESAGSPTVSTKAS